MNEWMNEWTPKRLHPDSIRDSIRILIVAADSIRDSIRKKISNSQVPTHMVKKHCFNMRDDNRLSIAQFMHESISLRDMVGRYGNLSLLSKDKLNCIVNYLATY